MSHSQISPIFPSKIFAETNEIFLANILNSSPSPWTSQETTWIDETICKERLYECVCEGRLYLATSRWQYISDHAKDLVSGYIWDGLVRLVSPMCWGETNADGVNRRENHSGGGVKPQVGDTELHGNLLFSVFLLVIFSLAFLNTTILVQREKMHYKYIPKKLLMKGFLKLLQTWTLTNCSVIPYFFT